MRKLLIRTAFILSAFAPMAAHAQATRTWVSGVGDDVNPCSRTAPCKTFAGAISKTAAGGLISVLDPGGYGTVTITKSITIAGDRQFSSILASSTNGIVINAGATDRVVIEGLDIDGSPPTAPGLNGIRILNAGEVLIRNSAIRNFTQASNGAAVVIDSNSKVRVSVADSVLANNLYGVRILPKPTNQAHLKMFNTLVVNNTSAGISVDGAGNDAVLEGSSFLGAVSLEILNGAQVMSYGNNNLSGSGLPTSTLPLR